MKAIFLLLWLSLMTLSATVISTGAQNTKAYLSALQNKNIAVVVNPSSTLNHQHLVDFLQSQKINIVKIFAPEHGFRGDADAGEHLKDGVDLKSGLSIISLYGKHKKPTPQDLEGVDIIVFDIQDVGVRFYTYLSTLHYILEAAAENGVKVIVLDRPNPNGGRIDGPLLQKEFRSFVGLHPVPILYDMTIGEYALMINGERWLKGGIKADLEVIPLQNYHHGDFYTLSIKPSPNLPNDLSIALYPSLTFFEGTNFSVGRGTSRQFQLYGAPTYKDKNFSFVPTPQAGAKYPKHQGKRCYGVDLSYLDAHKEHARGSLNLAYLLDAYHQSSDKKGFFLNKGGFFDKLSGSDRLREQIMAGESEAKIRASWQKDLDAFKAIREQYLLYP